MWYPCGIHAGPQHVRDEPLPLAHLVPDNFSDIADYTNDSFITSLEPDIPARLQNHHLCCYLAHLITDLWLHPLVLPYSPQATHTPKCKDLSRAPQIIDPGLHSLSAKGIFTTEEEMADIALENTLGMWGSSEELFNTCLQSQKMTKIRAVDSKFPNLPEVLLSVPTSFSEHGALHFMQGLQNHCHSVPTFLPVISETPIF